MSNKISPINYALADIKGEKYVNGSTKHSYKDFLITLGSKIKEDIITVKINETPIGVEGEITLINGQSKAGKTSSIIPNLIASSFLNNINEETDIDTLGIKSLHNAGRPIIYIDTEQTKSRTHKIIQTACRIAKISEHPDNLFALPIKSISHQEKKIQSFDFIKEIVKDTGKMPFLIIIDGFADFVTDPNIAVESINVVDEIMRLAEQYQCTVFGFLHMNPGSEKMRGHLGSHCERKAGAVISVSKKGGVYSITPQFVRHGKDFEPIVFDWNNEESRFMSIVGAEGETAKKRITDKSFNKNCIYVKTIQEIMKLTSKTHFTYAELKSNIMLHYQDKKKPSEAMTKNHITAMTKNEIIDKNEAGEYSLNASSEFIYR